MRKKKILIIGLTERMGGVETFIYNTTRFSNKNKYEYEYLVHGTDHCVFQNQISEFYGQEDCIHFVRKYKENPFGCIKDLVLFYCRNGKKYSYVHLETGANSEVLYVFPFNVFLDFKVISHSHNGNGSNPLINSLFRPIVNMISAKRLSCSKVATEWLFGKKYIDKTIIINNGIDTDKFIYSLDKRIRIRKQYDLKNEFLIGHIGRFSEQKNHEFILKIFKKIIFEDSSAKLMLVGVGEKEVIIRQLCNEMQLDKSVIFAGSQMEIEAYYCAFDVFLMPSLYEGLPIVGIEAQAEGLPCFFSSNISEKILITDRATVTSLDVPDDKWAKNIMLNKGLGQREKYAKVVKEKGYDIHETVKILEKVYEV